MAKQTETKFAELLFSKFIPDIKFKIHGHMMQASSWPDYYLCHEKFGGIWVELKVAPNKLSPKQEERIKQLWNLFIPASVITYFSETKEIEYEDASGKYRYLLNDMGHEDILALFCRTTRMFGRL